jgi:hypothetical protein
MEKLWLDLICQLGCIVCRNEINTTKCVSRHPYKKEFEKRYGTEETLLEQVQEWLKE